MKPDYSKHHWWKNAAHRAGISLEGERAIAMARLWTEVAMARARCQQLLVVRQHNQPKENK